MKNVRILDCTLRDGGRVIDCAFEDRHTHNIIRGLVESNIDIIEVGFLRDRHNVTYKGDSTFFTDVDQITPFLIKKQGVEYVAFVDYGMFDFDSLKPYDGKSIDGIRVGFTKKDYSNYYEDIIARLKFVKDSGYKLFIQGVNSLNYSDKELLGIVDMVNEISPEGFGIVDTYGAMLINDVQGLFHLIDRNLDKNIVIDFHAHNNYQLSFSFAQEVIRMSNGVRNVIIDSTLNGMGKGAGNLNTELLVNYLNVKHGYSYNFERLLDCIDVNLFDLSQEHKWGYSMSAMMAGIYKSHPNNIIYLLNKFRLNTTDIANILKKMSDSERQRYDYDMLDKLYNDYRMVDYDDTNEIEQLKSVFSDRVMLILCPGKTIAAYRPQIEKFISENKPIVVSVNYVDSASEYAFFGNKLRYAFSDIPDNVRVIVMPDVNKRSPRDIVVSNIGNDSNLDNSALIALNLMKRLSVRHIAIAGMDGYHSEYYDNYADKTNVNKRVNNSYFNEINRNVSIALEKFSKEVSSEIFVEMITPSIYENSIK